MRFPLLLAIIILIVNAAADLYIYCDLVSYLRKKVWPRVHAWFSVICFAAFLTAICLPKRAGSDGCLICAMWIIYAYASIYLPKYIFIIFDALSRLPMLWRGKQWRWMYRGAFVLSVIVFLAMWWGALVNRFMIDTNRVDIEVAGLPRGLDGLKIAQISDLHVGTFGSDTAFCSKLVDEVNALHPDIIVFTGDIVNRHSSELKPFTKTLSRLKAPLGVYSIMGNHDYGDYSDWPSPEAKKRDVAALQKMQADMGWKMLNNASAWIRWRGDSLALIGVENVGDPPFTTYGDLSAAYSNVGDNATKVLLTHNPSHWVNDIADSPNANIALTLSGHTHAMQVEILGLSPAVWRYKTWGGLYTDNKGQNLYVNIGAGEVGFPSRIGATPEISVFTLKHK